MKYAGNYLQAAIAVIQQYEGKLPFQHHLKAYFSAHKKHGSKDRKHISHACYCYYRLGQADKNLPIEEKIKLALFLCNNEPGIWAIVFDEKYLHAWSENGAERIAFIQNQHSIDVNNIFSWQDELSESIDPKTFILSHLVQPDLFIRVRPGKENVVSNKLKEQNIDFQKLSPTCIALPNNSKADSILELNKEAVIQDYSSQRIQEFLLASNLSSPTVWDCCAASGGKSILAYDTLKQIKLSVSDIRTTILQNLKQRFAEAGITKYNSFVMDAAKNGSSFKQKFDLIICDAPCSGSGTWGRTPEQLSFFTTDKIEYYANLQQKIVSNTIQHVAPGGYFLYITCSVFQKENEDITNFIQQKFPALQLIKKEVLIGYNKKADTMFAALFKVQ
ncbi:Fmu (Sun) domain-containing protein [Chitinophagaceae bacterium LWZ2-11]